MKLVTSVPAAPYMAIGTKRLSVPVEGEAGKAILLAFGAAAVEAHWPDVMWNAVKDPTIKAHLIARSEERVEVLFVVEATAPHELTVTFYA